MIKLKCINHDTEYEINNIIHLFEPYIEGDYELKSVYEKNLATAKLIKEDNVIFEKQSPIDEADTELKAKKNMKLMLKETVYEVLYQLTGKAMPWGMLTGIRPTKIVHDYQKQGINEANLREKFDKVYPDDRGS